MKWISGCLLMLISFSIQAQDEFLKSLEASPRHQEKREAQSDRRQHQGDLPKIGEPVLVELLHDLRVRVRPKVGPPALDLRDFCGMSAEPGTEGARYDLLVEDFEQTWPKC